MLNFYTVPRGTQTTASLARLVRKVFAPNPDRPMNSMAKVMQGRQNHQKFYALCGLNPFKPIVYFGGNWAESFRLNRASGIKIKKLHFCVDKQGKSLDTAFQGRQP